MENNLLLIHGPCALESEEQIDEIIKELLPISNYFRMGLYKPRTNIESFQGLKKNGLAILKKMKNKYPEIKTVVEITSIEQLNNIDDIDIIQIGARNMQNYELLIECGKTKKTILLKRGFGATLEELISACGYIEAQENYDIILCERGIRTFSESSRFTLDLAAITYLQEKTNYKVIVDPSHAGGEAKIVKGLIRASIAYGVDGLIVEVHPNPQKALSDSNQQLDIKEYQKEIRGILK